MTDSQVSVLAAGGLSNAGLIVEAADRTGVPLAIAAAMVEKESGGRNVYGHDTGGVFSVPGRDIEITQENYKEFLRRVLVGEKSNGVGPAQITYRGYFERYPEYPFWEPLANIKFGLTILADYLRGDYSDASVAAAGARYNGGTNPGPRALAYGTDLLTKTKAWRARLAATTEGKPVARIAISPSTQTWNAYTGVATNEQEQAYQQAEAFARVLREHGVEVRIMTRGKGDARNGYVAQAQESNDTGPWDAHICLHTDAGGATGTTGFYYPGDGRGQALAESIYAELAPISPGADHGVKARADLYELNSTNTHAVLMEAAPHDRAASARWIVDNPEAIGLAYGKGTLRWLGIPYRGNPTDQEDDMTPDQDRMLKEVHEALRRGQAGSHPAGHIPGQLTSFENLFRPAEAGRLSEDGDILARLKRIEARLDAAKPPAVELDGTLADLSAVVETAVRRVLDDASATVRFSAPATEN